MKFPHKLKEYNNSMTYFHNHHQIPRKAPYLSELQEYKEEWTVDLTVEGHVCQHDILYRVFGWEGDRIASQGLSGFIGNEEAHRQACVLGGKSTPVEQHREMGRRGSATRKEKGYYGLGYCHAIPVVAKNKKTGKEQTFPSLKSCADALGLHPPHVSACWRGLRKSTGGWTFRRAE